MNLLLFLDIDELNFTLQRFLGNKLIVFCKHYIKSFIFRPLPNQYLSQIGNLTKCFLSPQMRYLKDLDLSSLDNESPNDYFFLSNLNELSSLDLSTTGIKSLDGIYGLINLEYLYLCDCEQIFLIENYQISNLRKLKVLDLSGSNIIDIPSQISLLNKLEVLNISGCDRLKSLPDSLGFLESLKKLFIVSCEKLISLNENIGNLKKLTHLDICYNRELTRLPKSIYQLTNLETLNLRGISNFSFNINISKLKYLKNLKVCDSKIQKIQFPNLKENNLQRLSVTNCSQLTALDFENSTQLKHVSLLSLNLAFWPNNLFYLHNLQFLNLNCQGTLSLPDIFENLNNLEHLILSHSNIEMLPSSIGTLKKLITLELTSMSILELFPEIGNLKLLNHLKLDCCPSITTLPLQVTQLDNLSNISIDYCNSFRVLPSKISTLPNLKVLECTNSQLKLIPTNNNTLSYNIYQSPLKKINLSSNKFNDYSWSTNDFIHLANLQILEMSYNNFERLPVEIELLTSLKILRVEGCQYLKTIPRQIFRLHHLEEFNFSGCLNLTTLPFSYSNFDSLKDLKLLYLGYTCLRFICFEHDFGYNLECLSLNNTEVTFLPDSIGKQKYLKQLDLSACFKLTTLPESISNLKNLEYLNLSDCVKFQRLPRGVTKLHNIKLINLCQTRCYIDYLPVEFKEKIHFSQVSSNLDY